MEADALTTACQGGRRPEEDDASPPRDRRDDRDLVAILDRGAEPAAEAHVFIVHVEHHERGRLAVLVLESGPERGKARGQVRDGLAEGPALGLEWPGLTGLRR